MGMGQRNAESGRCVAKEQGVLYFKIMGSLGRKITMHIGLHRFHLINQHYQALS
jgi:hypothetical protein